MLGRVSQKWNPFPTLVSIASGQQKKLVLIKVMYNQARQLNAGYLSSGEFVGNASIKSSPHLSWGLDKDKHFG